jgi:hypothetical protein
VIIFSACKPAEVPLTAQQIIDKTILFSGADKIVNSKITFKFRDKEYAAIRQNGIFKLLRNSQRDTIAIEELLTNNGYERFVNQQQVEVVDSMVSKYSNSINSVHYFSVLPYGLNDVAVQKKLLEPSTIHGKEYYKVQISFSESGGGEDFEDVFIYWIGKENFLIDYLAYSYHTNGGGMRFRVLKEQCIKNGIRFVDYFNYKPTDTNISLQNTDKAYEKNELKKVSEIILKDIEVKLLDSL